MRIDAGLDTGDIVLNWETPIDPDETAPELSPRLAAAGAALLVETLDGLSKGTLKPVPQDSSLASWAPILKKEDGRIDWTLPAKTIHNLIRGLLPWPGAHSTFRGQSLHLWRSRLAANKSNLAPGTLIADGGLFVVAGDGNTLEILELQLEGRKRMPAAVFANGHRIEKATHKDGVVQELEQLGK
jgi:methionyl-tRNA formyltransferase